MLLSCALRLRTRPVSGGGSSISPARSHVGTYRISSRRFADRLQPVNPEDVLDLGGAPLRGERRVLSDFTKSMHTGLLKLFSLVIVCDVGHSGGPWLSGRDRRGAPAIVQVGADVRARGPRPSGCQIGDTEGSTAMRAKTRLTCPCGAAIAGTDEDELVAKTQGHLLERHPGMEYSRDEILFIAY